MAGAAFPAFGTLEYAWFGGFLLGLGLAFGGFIVGIVRLFKGEWQMLLSSIIIGVVIFVVGFGSCAYNLNSGFLQ